MSWHCVVIVAHIRAHLMSSMALRARASMLGLSCLLLLLLRLERGAALFGHLHDLRCGTPGTTTPITKSLGSGITLRAWITMVSRWCRSCRRSMVAGLRGGHAINRAIGQHAATLLLLILAEMVIVVAWRWS